VSAGEPYELIVAPPAKRALAEALPLAVAFAAWEFIDGPLRANPRRVGRPLRAPFVGHWSARRGTYRVRYRIDEDKHLVVVLDIVGRADAYRSGRA
jgi:mRNA interferase RelE/StbE